MNDSLARVEDVQADSGHEMFVVRPAESRGPGIIYLHWFDEAPNANRSQFLEEAERLAAAGVTSVLPQLTFPWHHPPVGIDSDLARIRGEVDYLRTVWSTLSSVAGVDPSCIAVVGHDFGAMYGTLLLQDLEVRCAVFVAATPRWADWFLRFWPIDTDRYDYLRRMSVVDPVGAVAETACPMLFQFGDRDFYIAGMTARELVDAAPEASTHVTYPTGHAMDLPEIRTDRISFLSDHLGFVT